MPKCKLSVCREDAVPGAVKRYCGKHLEEYLQTKKEMKKRRASMPKCACGQVAKLGANECSGCAQKRLEKEALEAEYAALPKCACGQVANITGKCKECLKLEFESTKHAEFEAATTVSELKLWIRKYAY